MKTRDIKLSTDTTLTLLDAYNHPKKIYEIKADEITSVLVPLHREVYIDEFKKPYFIYDGQGVLEEFDLALEDFILTRDLIEDFDSFLLSNKASKSNQILFHQILSILDKPKIIFSPLVRSLEEKIIERAIKCNSKSLQ